MLRFLIPFLLFTAAACTPRPGEMAVQTDKSMSATVPTPSAWRIVSFSVDGEQSEALNDKGFVALRDGQIGGNTGCNAFGGEYSGSASKMKVGGVMATKMFCKDVNAQERAVLDLFNGTVNARMDGKALVLSGGDNELRLERDDALLDE